MKILRYPRITEAGCSICGNKNTYRLSGGYACNSCGCYSSDPGKLYKDKIPNGLRKKVFARDGRVCKNCGLSEDLTLDHIIPEINGGQTSFDNLQVLCRKCNSSKGAR